MKSRSSAKIARRTSHLATMLTALFLLATLLSGCEFIKDLLFSEEEGGEETIEACQKAEACCEELSQASAFSEVGEKAGKRNQWPNHCPSWNARSESECNELMTAVDEQMETLVKEHPVFEPEACQQ